MAKLPEPTSRQFAPFLAGRADQTHILYVEDEEGIRQLSERALARAGYAVTTAADGLEGWTALAAQPFDLVVTDHDMPHITGIELIARAHRQGLVVPFILVSGAVDGFEVAENQGLRLGAWLQKPFDLSTLLALVRKVLIAAPGTRQEKPVFSPGLADALRRAESDRRPGLNG